MQKDLDLARPMFADLFVDDGQAGGLAKELGQRGQAQATWYGVSLGL